MPAQGHIRQRASGAWYVVIPLPQREGGTKQRWFKAGPTRAHAERLRARLVHELAEGTYLDASTIPLAEFLEEWIDHLAGKGRRARTLSIYRLQTAQHIAPALGKTPLAKLTTRQIEAYYARALTNGRMDGKAGLSASTVRLHHGILRAALRQAVKWGMIARSPIDSVEPPAPGPHVGRALPTEELRRLADLARGHWLEIPILLAAFGGLRRGEVLGLSWDDVTWEPGAVAIAAAKTDAGIRSVALPAFVMEALRREKGRQAAAQLALARKWKGDGRVVCRPDGAPWHPSSITQSFREFAAAGGFGHLRFHDLRHCAATTLILGGLPVKLVSARLGHRTTGITENLYGHLLREADDAAAGWLEERFGGSR